MFDAASSRSRLLPLLFQPGNYQVLRNGVLGMSPELTFVIAWKRLEGLKPAALILHGAAVGTRCRSLDGLAGQGLPKRLIDVVRRAGNVFHVVRCAIIDRAIVDDDALWVDDNHLRSCLGVIKMADGARWVE